MTRNIFFNIEWKTLLYRFKSSAYRLGLLTFVLFFLSSILFERHAGVIGHKAWLISWAYADIFHPPEYDPKKVESMARVKLFDDLVHEPHNPQVVGARAFGEECIIFRLEYFDPEQGLVQSERAVWVHWKPWTMNNGYKILNEEDVKSLINHRL